MLAKLQGAMVVKVEVVVAGTLVLSNELHFMEKPTLLPLCHSKEVKSVGYIRGPFFLCCYKSFHFT